MYLMTFPFSVFQKFLLLTNISLLLLGKSYRLLQSTTSMLLTVLVFRKSSNISMFYNKPLTLQMIELFLNNRLTAYQSLFIVLVVNGTSLYAKNR